MVITFIAQSGFIIEENGISIGIDLWFKNPVNTKNIEDIPKLDYLFCTHDHPDHGFTDMIELAKRDNSLFIAVSELATYAARQGAPNIIGANIGGEFTVQDLKVFLTPAHHTANIGVPVGFIIQFPNGKTVYHMGDTGYFALSYIPELYKIDTLLVPIGSFYTMGTREAIMAVRDIKPESVIPMHYNTFPAIKADPAEFKTMVESLNINCNVMQPDDSITV